MLTGIAARPSLPKPQTLSRKEREYYLDWLRVIAILLLLFFHCGMAFVAEWGWHIKNPETSQVFQEWMYFLSRWRMALLFFISGAGTWFVMRRATAGAYVWRRFLRLFVPLVFGIFALFWFSTGLVSLGPGRERGIELVMSGGTSHTVALLATLSGGLADTVIGILIAFRRTCRIGLYAAFVISITYAIIGSILVPWLWYDPLGPMLKISPIIVLNLVALAILDER